MDKENTARMFELSVEDYLIQKDCSGLALKLQQEGLDHILVVRLDKMVTQELSVEGFKSATLLLKAIGRISEKKEDLHLLLKHGLGPKVLHWFETVRGLLGSETYRNADPLQNLAEEFYDYFLLLGQPTLHVSVFLLSTILSSLARLVLKPAIAFSPRLEAIRTYNTLLESLDRKERKRLQVDVHQHEILDELAASILTVGDYELQVSISEALCRMTPRKVREQRAKNWFSRPDVINAFCRIRDGDFEVDCRFFLNYINCCQGNQRRVYTIPCLRAFLGNTELFSPKDDKLDQFWIDFNLGSECISFFIDDQQGFLWGSVHLQKHGVKGYTLNSQQNELNEEETVVRLELSRPVVHRSSRETRVQLSFSPQHHSLVLEAVGKVLNPAVSQEPTGFLHMRDREEEVLTPSRGGRTYYKKKPKSKLKIIPLSSASSEDDLTPSPLYASTPSRAEILFDQILKMLPKDKTPPSQISKDSGLPKDSLLGLSAEGTDWDGDGDQEQPEDRDLDHPERTEDHDLDHPEQPEGPDLDPEWTEDPGQTADSGMALEQTEDLDPGRTVDPGLEPGWTEDPGWTARGQDPEQTEDLDPGRDPGQTVDPGRTADRGLEPGRTARGLDPGRTVDRGDRGVPVQQNVLITPRKRTSPRTEPPIGASCPKKKVWSVPVGEEPGLSLKGGPVETPSELPPSELPASIQSDFNALIRQLQDSMAAATQRCLQRVEGQVVESFTECQHNVSSLLKAVHQHRLLLLQRFQKRVVDQMNQLQDMFQSLSNMETEILSFLRSQVQSLSSFCDRQQRGLASLDYKNQEEGEVVGRRTGGEAADNHEA